MKFEHMLYRQLVSEWRNCYIDYAGLKSIVEALSDYAKALRAKDLDQRLICEKRMASVFRQLTVEFSELYEIEWRMVKSFLEFKACQLRQKYEQALTINHESLSVEDLALYSRFMTTLYQQAYFLRNYIELNSEGFRKILKKMKKVLAGFKAEFQNDHEDAELAEAGSACLKQIERERLHEQLKARSREIKELIAKVEEQYVSQVSDGDNSKEVRYQLRALVDNEQLSHSASFALGIFLGFSLLMVVMIVLTSYETQDLTNFKFFRQAFPILRGSALIILYFWVLCLDVFYWNSFNVNFRNVFRLSSRFAKLPALLALVSSLTCFWLIFCCWWLLQKTGFTAVGRIYLPSQLIDFLPLFPWLVIALFLLLPVPFPSGESDLLLFRLIGRSVFCLCYPMSFDISWLTDQLISLINPFRDLYSMICYYASGGACPTSLNIIPNVVLGILFHVLRIMQCVRQGYDHGQYLWTPFFYNSIKYLFSIVTQLFSYAYSRNQQFLGVWIALAAISTIFSYYWDLRHDWDLLNPASSKLLLRDELSYSKGHYYAIMAVNLLLRFAWVLSISPDFLVASGFESIYFVLMISALQILRRGLWNFLRVQKEYLNNCKKFNAIQFPAFEFGRQSSADESQEELPVQPLQADPQPVKIQFLKQPQGDSKTDIKVQQEAKQVRDLTWMQAQYAELKGKRLYIQERVQKLKLEISELQL